MAKPKTKSAAWMIAHPDDTPPPSGQDSMSMAAAREWRAARGIGVFPDPREQALREKYERAIAAKRAHANGLKFP